MQRLRITQNVAAVTGACLLMPRTVFEQVGGFDEGFVLAFNDVDLCLQVLQAGLPRRVDAGRGAVPPRIEDPRLRGHGRRSRPGSAASTTCSIAKWGGS